MFQCARSPRGRTAHARVAGFESVPEAWIGLRHTSGIFDAHSWARQAENRERHGHPMVAVAMHDGGHDRPRSDAQPVVTVLHLLPQTLELVDGSHEPVRLFDANVGHI